MWYVRHYKVFVQPFPYQKALLSRVLSSAAKLQLQTSLHLKLSGWMFSFSVQNITA